MAKRLGIMGGTFNPIHNGHLRVAEIAMRELKLDEVRFIPTGDSPHKQHVDMPGNIRLDMVAIAIKDMPGFTVSDIEIKRSGRSYTCDTLRQMRMAERDTDMFFIMGGDMMSTFTTWRNPDIIVRLAKLAVVSRPGDDIEHIYKVCQYLRMEYSADVYMLSETGPDISSTDIRLKVQNGDDIGELVPHDVERYILDNGLYKALETGNDI